MFKLGIQDSIHLEYKCIKSLMKLKEIKKVFKDIIILNIFIYYIPSLIYYYLIPNIVSIFVQMNTNYYNYIINTFWYIPILVITHLSNLHFYSKIIYLYSQKINNNKMSNIKYISQSIFYQLCFLLINLSINLLYYLPYFGNFIYLILLTFFYSYYCYDYKYNIYKIDYNSKIHYYEKNWVYFLGNGFPFAIILIIFNSMECFILTSILLPLMIINSIYKKRNLKSNYIRIPFFTIPKYIINNLLKEGYQTYIKD
jgi:hypothetical protein